MKRWGPKLAVTHRQHSAGLIISGSKSPVLCYIATSYGSYRYIWLEDLSLFSNLDSATILQFVTVVGVDCITGPNSSTISAPMTWSQPHCEPWTAPPHDFGLGHVICFVRDGRPVPSLNLPSPLVRRDESHSGWPTGLAELPYCCSLRYGRPCQPAYKYILVGLCYTNSKLRMPEPFYKIKSHAESCKSCRWRGICSIWGRT